MWVDPQAHCFGEIRTKGALFFFQGGMGNGGWHNETAVLSSFGPYLSSNRCNCGFALPGIDARTGYGSH